MSQLYASHKQGSKALKNIGRLLPNLLTDEEMGQLSVEANKHVADSDVKSLAAISHQSIEWIQDFG